jgi:glycerophosphoryl diester phosphodiesterase
MFARLDGSAARIMGALFDLQGHRGARGLKPENTLPSFEVALDIGVTSIETDVHLTRDNVPVLFHDAVVTEWLCKRIPNRNAPDPGRHPLVRSLSLAQLRCYQADLNPDPRRFPDQDAGVTPLARLFAEQHGIDPYTVPSLADLLAFVQAYTGALGSSVGKTPAQQAAARKVRLDLELKRVPFYPHIIGDPSVGPTSGILELGVLELVRRAGLVKRTIIRSFDHQSVKAIRKLEPQLTAAVLIAETAPVSPVQIVRQADASIYCPSFEYLHANQVRDLQKEGIRVIPWTANEADVWLRLLDWGVDGITTDFPHRLAELLRKRRINYTAES